MTKDVTAPGTWILILPTFITTSECFPGTDRESILTMKFGYVLLNFYLYLIQSALLHFDYLRARCISHPLSQPVLKLVLTAQTPRV